ncbi:class I SAM-dependent methyltransferase [Rubripirellula sp.]|nr:methyltransferase domain-containing protein [Planctomycetaceae bacterium]MDA9856974.1 class I SAM-dependent methyltransferase [Rubripirellula sp.]MDF1844753.1 methionine biosynthesis protein MetW [Rubripirellula sp.]
MINPIHWFHERNIHQRRIDVLANWIANRIPSGASVLDVGCGDGELAAKIQKRRPDLKIKGLEVLVRGETAIPVDAFDGCQLPYENNDVDIVMMVDVLHHSDFPQQLMDESARVAKKQIIIKDHYLQGLAAYRTLAFMDQVGNSRHGVAIPCNYLTPDQWIEMFRCSDLQVQECIDHLGLYPPPLNWLFERRLHFLAVLENISH